MPVTGSAGVLGALGVVFDTPRTFDAGDQQLLVAIGAQIGIAVERAELFERTQREAETLQLALTPRRQPVADQVEVATLYEPAGSGRVGGDWYDVTLVADGVTALVVGDVVGRGVPAVAAMARLRHALLALLHEGYSPAAALEALSRLAGRDRSSGFGATVVCAMVDAGQRSVRVAWAGHPPAVVRDRGGARLLPHGGSPPLGVQDAAVAEVRLAIVEPLTLVLYPDGLVERRSEDLGRLLDGLVERVAASEPAPDAITAALRHLIPPDHDDDVTVVAARIRP